MKLRSIALAGAAALAISFPAAASDATGWYFGLGVGWDMPSKVTAEFTPGPVDLKFSADDSALFIGTFGYRFNNRFRIENEIGYVTHDLSGTSTSRHRDRDDYVGLGQLAV